VALDAGFLDRVRDATVLSSLIGRTVKVTKAGREFKACCPFHGEKTPSFTINDDKQFAHCFGCGWHGDAFRWLMQHDGLTFIEAVRQLAEAAGIEMPAPSPRAAEAAKAAATVRDVLDRAQAIYAGQLEQAGAVMEYLAGRGIGPDAVRAFGLGYARGMAGSLKGQGISEGLGRQAGLLVDRQDIGAGPGEPMGVKELFWDRITVPIHDSRGRLAGFGARVWPQRRNQQPKFVNSPDGPLFDKGRLLFNLHRAAPLARPQAEGRLLVVEGYFDVIALAGAGVGAVVAPMGTAMTAHQLERCWRVHHRPVLLFDGDEAGRRAAVRAVTTALPMLGPGHGLGVAFLPAGQDPDDLVRALGPDAAARAIDAMVCEARGGHDVLFDAVVAGVLGDEAQHAAARAPERVAGIWDELSGLVAQIGHDETRVQVLAAWRARFDREVSAVPAVAGDHALHAVRQAEEGEYAFPESESDSAARLIAIVRAVVKKRAERKAITEEIADVMKMAEALGFVKKEISAVVRDIESDLAHGPAVREEAEMARVLYRRTLGIRGPMTEAMLPQVVEGRARAPSAQLRRRAATHALIDARGLDV